MACEPKEEPTRLERYLSHILANPDTWIHISKNVKKGVLQSANESHNERVQIINDIKTALDLMGIKYQMKKNASYTIRVVTKNQQTNSTSYYVGGFDRCAVSIVDALGNIRIKLGDI